MYGRYPYTYPQQQPSSLDRFQTEPYSYMSDGDRQAGQTVGQVAGAAIPIYGAMRAVSGGMAAPLQRFDATNKDTADLQNSTVNQNNPSMQMQSAPKTAQGGAFGALGEMGNMFMPGSVRALNGADTPTAPPVTGGTSMQPSHVDSSHAGWSSALNDYMNYMKYRSQP